MSFMENELGLLEAWVWSLKFQEASKLIFGVGNSQNWKEVHSIYIDWVIGNSVIISCCVIL